MDTKKVDSQLNTLLTRNYDSEKSYEFLADKTEDGELKAFFKNNYEERFRFGHEIKDMLKDYDIEPDKGTSTKADLHRSWMNIKELVAENSTVAILEEAERGEQMAIDDYEHAVVSREIKPGHKKILSDQLHSIKNSKQQIERFKVLNEKLKKNS